MADESDAKTRSHRLKAIAVAGTGFFAATYNLSCFNAVTKLIGRLYYPDPAGKAPGRLPARLETALMGAALCGALAGQLFFGWLGDGLGRRKAYTLAAAAMAGSALASGLSFGRRVVPSLGFFRFWLGFGAGGAYPLSAAIASECAGKGARGGFVAAVFAMEGFGILAASVVAMIVSKAFLGAEEAARPEGDFVWRIVLVFGAAPAALTLYWLGNMPETAVDMARVLRRDGSNKLLSREFLRKHGLRLVGTAGAWFFLDMALYGLIQVAQKDLYLASGLVPKASAMSATEEVFKLSRAMFLITLVAAVPGYWLAVFFVDKIGRSAIQLGGFLLMSAFMAMLGLGYESLRGRQCVDPSSAREYCDGDAELFALLYGLTLFFANFGPNSTTFVVAAELFPARLRATCHGVSAAAGKAGAIVGVLWVQSCARGAEGVSEAVVALAVMNLVGFCLTFLVPETNGRSLEEISGEDLGSAGNGGEREREASVDEILESEEEVAVV